MPSDFEMKEEWEMYPTVADADDVRVWEIHIYFKNGDVISFDGEEAFWGTGENARAVAEDTAYNYDSAGFPVERWETELDENG